MKLSDDNLRSIMGGTDINCTGGCTAGGYSCLQYTCGCPPVTPACPATWECPPKETDLCTLLGCY